MSFSIGNRLVIKEKCVNDGKANKIILNYFLFN